MSTPTPPFKSVLPLAPRAPSLRQQYREGLKQHRLRLQSGLAPEAKPQLKPESKVVLKTPPRRSWIFTTVLRPPTPPPTEESDTESSVTGSIELDFFTELYATIHAAPRVELDAELTQPHVVFAIDFDAELRALRK